MKLWILQPIEPWDPWYDRAFGFVVRAQTEQEARVLASTEAGDEGGSSWQDEDKTTCYELTAEGFSCVVLRDFWAA